MDYQSTLNWMFKQLPMYQKIGLGAYKKDLSNTLHLISYLNHPHNDFKTIHVGGTNGKGSVSHMLASVLHEAGYKVGLYTSPHLKDFRERIRINGSVIPKEYVVNFIENHFDFFDNTNMSFFEMTVGMAFKYFSEQKVDIAVIEVGLGGRLDSTNVINPEVSVITNIGYDHTHILGNTLQKIAKEKAGIFKNKVPVVIGKGTQEVNLVFKKKSLQTKSELYFAEAYSGKFYPTDLQGHYQIENTKTVLQVITVLQGKGWEINNNAIKLGLNSVVKNTGMKGRWHVINSNPKVICDTAHNEDGINNVVSQLNDENFQVLHIVLGMVNDKNLSKILPLFPKNARYYFVSPVNPRAIHQKELKDEAVKFDLKGNAYKSTVEGYNAALQSATKDDVIYVGGSTFVVAEII